MSNRALLYLLMAASLIAVSACMRAEAADSTTAAAVSETIDLFEAMEDDLVDVKFVARDDRRGRLIVDNKTGEPLELRLPETFVGVPVLAQFGGGAGGFGGGGGGLGGGGGQAVGGGGGGGFGGAGGGGQFGGGGGAFSVAPEKAAKIDVGLLCLDHGKRVPSSSKPYKIVPADEHLASKPEVIELLAAFGRGELQRGAAQAAVWHANSEVSWQELAAKLDGTKRSTVRNPYFSRQEMHAAVAYYQEAMRRATQRSEESDDQSESSESMSKEAAKVEG